ncbi:uncharacterized protein LOC119114050 [Pollicipes pollicipes]|uniref:uncharacterized protein LOC119114043 n=1 Tax=Pollicipes pollicipes TaxID=41117 RepID=UPI0018859DCC|nr:uncharacterized protein LOC119114043 [Pollicipes pollicipes]XP_037094173.1 uncharacterized protein LOC119114050 [Pollicipes pollicipes]
MPTARVTLCLLVAAAALGPAEPLPDIRSIVARVVDDARQQLVSAIGFCSASAAKQAAPFQCVAAPIPCPDDEDPITIGKETFCQAACPAGLDTLDQADMFVCVMVRKTA